ncbi:MAG: bifunctional DNA-formamidopyrimidine glycosylase/DNA-(apurinic or apyrimidinic site) lyase [Planctomycetota bacterium]
MVAMRLLAASSSPATCAAPAATVPELPEVETVRAGAEPHLRGRRLRRYEQTRPDLRWPLPEAALRALVGRTCTAVERRSKYLLVRFDGDGAPAAIVHLGMTGRLLVDALDGTAPRPEWRKHEHWRMDFGDRLVRFVDPRRFGALDVTDAADLPTHPLLAVLGQEPLQPGFDGGFLRRVSRGKKANVKALLMDGRILVGVGNIYASEACWRARVRPRRAAGSLTRAECDARAAAVRELRAAAIAAGGTSFRDYVGVDEDAGFFARELAVYERDGQPCPRCDAKVKRAVDSGRSTYWCSGCQR